MGELHNRTASGAPHLRALALADGELLWQATEFNVNWQQRLLDRAAIAADRRLAHYCTLVPARGDFGLVAEIDGEPVGVVWLLQFGADDPGYGFVGEGIPELCVCVWPGFRGRGIGRQLLEAALDEGRRRGLLQVSLSVENGNQAARLYRALGFRPAGEASTETYVIDLCVGQSH